MRRLSGGGATNDGRSRSPNGAPRRQIGSIKVTILRRRDEGPGGSVQESEVRETYGFGIEEIVATRGDRTIQITWDDKRNDWRVESS